MTVTELLSSALSETELHKITELGKDIPAHGMFCTSQVPIILDPVQWATVYRL